MNTESTSLRARMKRRLPDFDRMRQRIRGRARALRRRFRDDDEKSLVDRLTEIDEEYVERGTEDITAVDLDTVVERAEAIEERFQSNGPLQRLLRDGRLLLELVRDARRGRYRAVPVWTLSAAGFTLLYVLNPFDIVPDALPLLGLLDDAAVVSACFSLVEQDLRDYQNWKRAQQKEKDSPEDLISS
ncbi:MAG: YkvA family protein [Salinibacter sp.]